MAHIKENSKWIYTYDYAPDSVWDVWRQSDAVPSWISEESAEVTRRVASHIPDQADGPVGNGDRRILTYILLADSHFTYNGTWDDTVASMQSLAGHIDLDGIIHLGDLSDGLLPLDKTREIEGRCISDMESLGLPVYLVPGNHDYNCFTKIS